MQGEAFNIGSAEQNYRIRDLAEIVHERLPECEMTFAEDASPDPRSYRVDFSKFASTFPECRFEWTAERGADELALAYEAVGLSLEDFQGHRFLRPRSDQAAARDPCSWTTTCAGRMEPTRPLS